MIVFKVWHWHNRIENRIVKVNYSYHSYSRYSHSSTTSPKRTRTGCDFTFKPSEPFHVFCYSIKLQTTSASSATLRLNLLLANKIANDLSVLRYSAIKPFVSQYNCEATLPPPLISFKLYAK